MPRQGLGRRGAVTMGSSYGEDVFPLLWYSVIAGAWWVVRIYPSSYKNTLESN